MKTCNFSRVYSLATSSDSGVRQSVQHGVVVTVSPPGKEREGIEAHIRKNRELADEARRRGDKKSAERYESIARTTEQYKEYHIRRSEDLMLQKSEEKQLKQNYAELMKKIEDARRQGKFLDQSTVAYINSLGDTPEARALVAKYDNYASSLGSITIDGRKYKTEQSVIDLIKSITGKSEDEIRKALPVGYSLNYHTIRIGVNKYGELSIQSSADVDKYKADREAEIMERETATRNRLLERAQELRKSGRIKEASRLEQAIAEADRLKAAGKDTDYYVLVNKAEAQLKSMESQEVAVNAARNISKSSVAGGLAEVVPPTAVPTEKLPEMPEAEAKAPPTPKPTPLAVSPILLIAGVGALGAVAYFMFLKPKTPPTK